jgi:hypothetical protein
MQTRWTMSFLRGPLTRDQISKLMANQRTVLPKVEPMPAYLAPPSRAEMGNSGFEATPDYQRPSMSPPSMAMTVAPPSSMAVAEPALDDAPPGFSSIEPTLPRTIQQYYLPTEYAVEQSVKNWEAWTRQGALNVQTKKRLLYRPSLLAQAQIRYEHTKTNTMETLWYAFVVPNLPRLAFLEWSEYQAEPFDPHTLDPNPFARAFYGEVPQTLSSGTGFKDLQDNLVDWLYTNAKLHVFYNPSLKMYSDINEDRRDFLARLQSAAREGRDAELEKNAAAYDKKLQRLEDKAQTKSLRLDSERNETEARKREELLAGGETVWRLMKGRSYQTLSRAGRLRRFTTQAEDRVGIYEQELIDIADTLEATEQEMQETLQAIDDKWRKALQDVQETPITPYKKDISFILFGIGWVPYWDVSINGTPTILPASSSGISSAQDPSLGSGARYY